MAAVTAKAHQAVSQYEDDNVGVRSAQETAKAVETTAYTVDHAAYSHKLKAYDKAEKLVKKSDKANIDALHEKFKKNHPDADSNFLSRWKQKQAIKKNTLPQKLVKTRQSGAASTAKGTGKAEKVQSLSQKS